MTRRSSPYNRPLLVRPTYEDVFSEKSRDIFLQASFQSISLSIDDGETDVDVDDQSGEKPDQVRRLSAIYFFLPCKRTRSLSTPLPPLADVVKAFAWKH